MKILLFHLFLLFTFFCYAQNTTNDISILQEKINQFEKVGDTLNEQYSITLNELAFKYQKKGKYSNAELLFLKVLERNKQNIEKKPLYYSASCINLALLYQVQNKYLEAEPLYLNALGIFENYSETYSLNDSNVLNNLGVLYQHLDKYSKAEHFHLKSIELKKKYFETKPLDYATSLKNLALVYEEEGKYLEAESYFLKSIEIEKEVLGEKDLEYAESLNYLAEFYFLNKKYMQAQPLFIKSLSIRKEILGENHLDYATSLNNLGALYGDLGKYSEAESFLLKALKIRLEILGKKSQPYLKTLNNLAIIYAKQQKYSEAEPLFIKILEINKEIFGVNNQNYLNSLNHLAQSYDDQGKYYEAEHLYLKSLEIAKKILGEKDLVFATAMDKLAGLNYRQEKYAEAESLFLKTLKIRLGILGEKNLDYIDSLNGLAAVYIEERKFTESESAFLNVLEITKEILGKNNLTYAQYLNNLANLYDTQGRHSEAEPLYLKALEIKNKILGEKTASYAISLTSLGYSYRQQGKYSEAEPLYLKSLEIKKEVIGDKHPSYIRSLLHLAILYRIMGLNEKSAIYFEQFTKANQNRITDDIYSLTEEELMSYFNINGGKLFISLSFLNDFPNAYPETNSSCFQSVLTVSNLSLRNTEQFKKAIQKSNNLLLKDKYEQFVSKKRQLTKLSELPIDKRTPNFKTLVAETAQLEKELSKESIPFSEFKKSISVTFKQIKDKLKKNEVLIDIVSYRYKKKDVGYITVYSAFVVGKDFKAPKFITLFEEQQLAFLLERNKSQQDSIRIDKQYLDKTISDLFLKHLEKELEGISTIYLSPSGLGHQIDFSALPINDNQTFGEKFKVHVLSSPAQIIDYKATGLDNKNNLELLLYGGIDYDKTYSVAKAGTDIAENNESLKELQTRSGISEFGYLAGSKKEVIAIQEKSIKNGFKATILDNRNATEESIKQLDGRTSPFVLHLATHGFFFPDPQQETPKDFNLETEKRKIYKASDDPMIRSGLVFAGANKNWSKPTENITTEDGILTASDISNLDLSACQLVVLSACETGLGQVKGSEGVFGLQRAFKMAGVKNIIMSLWKVPDAQTAELFEIFYGECFAGKTIHEAFQTAQAKMKAKYSPYYWAGFVLLE